MNDGYIRLWRKSLDSGLIKNHKVWIFWTWCLMKANHKQDFKQVVGFKEILLQPGDFVLGRKAAAYETGLSTQNIRTCISFLSKCENLTIKSTNKFSIISITNWDTYQYNINKGNQLTNQQLTNNQPTTNQQLTTNKNNITTKQLNKKVKKEILKKNKYLEFVFLGNGEYEKLIEKYSEQVVKNKIDDLNNYIGSTGKKYKSHYHTILAWLRKDAPKDERKRFNPDTGCRQTDANIRAAQAFLEEDNNG